jgi:hypothetical protein
LVDAGVAAVDIANTAIMATTKPFIRTPAFPCIALAFINKELTERAAGSQSLLLRSGSELADMVKMQHDPRIT